MLERVYRATERIDAHGVVVAQPGDILTPADLKRHGLKPPRGQIRTADKPQPRQAAAPTRSES